MNTLSLHTQLAPRLRLTNKPNSGKATSTGKAPQGTIRTLREGDLREGAIRGRLIMRKRGRAWEGRDTISRKGRL